MLDRALDTPPQKLPLELLFRKSCSQKFRNIHKKTLFNKVAGLQVSNFIKRETPTLALSC